MPKEASSKQFRKGTKSCVECRRRKLRCIPSTNATQPCQNCAAKGLRCVSQVHAGRGDRASTTTSRDRISQLEGSVGKLWSVVNDLRTELGHRTSVGPAPPDHAIHSDSRMDEDDDYRGSESDNSDMSPLYRPTHLHQLFDKEISDTHEGNTPSLLPDSSPEKAAAHSVSVRARSRLQPLIPPRADFLELVPLAATWIGLHTALMPPFSVFKTVDDLKPRYEELLAPDADPVAIGALLLWMGTAVQHASPQSLSQRSELVRDGPRFVRRVLDAVERNIVMDDTIAASIPGIELSMLSLRLKLSNASPKAIWLSLRRCIAIAEVMGLPRSNDAINAAAWQSICIVDRLISLIFNMPLGTTIQGLPPRQEVMCGQEVDIRAYLNNLARISTAVQDLDNAHSSETQDDELFAKVQQIDRDLHSLRALTPDTWWTQSLELSVPAILMQFWHHYLTARAHIQLALRNSTRPEYTSSFLTCTQACRDATDRYIQLRSLVPASFFASRVVDFEAMTAAVILVYTSHRSDVTQASGLYQQTNYIESSRQVAFRIVHTWDSICSQAGSENQAGLDVARKAAKAVRLLDKVLNEPATLDSQTLSLRIPLLGRLNVSRHSKPAQAVQAPGPGQMAYAQPGLQAEQLGDQFQAFDPAVGMEKMDPWTMDFFTDYSLPLMDGEDFLTDEQFFTFVDG